MATGLNFNIGGNFGQPPANSSFGQPPSPANKGQTGLGTPSPFASSLGTNPFATNSQVTYTSFLCYSIRYIVS